MPQCSPWHYSQQPKHASIQNVQLLTKMEQKVSYIQTVDYNSAIKKQNKIMPSVATCTDVDVIILNLTQTYPLMSLIDETEIWLQMN